MELCLFSCQMPNSLYKEMKEYIESGKILIAATNMQLLLVLRNSSLSIVFLHSNLNGLQ